VTSGRLQGWLVTRHKPLATDFKMSNPPITPPVYTPEAGEPRAQGFYDTPGYRPVATYVLIALNLVVFGLMTWAGGSTKPEVLLDFGASYGPYLRQGEYWRLVMPMFLHIGWLHLLINMYALYLLGRILEHLYGYGRFALLYVGSGMFSSYLSMAVGPHVAAGASGAIFGIAGAMLVAGFLHRASIPRRLRRVFGSGMLLMVVANLVFGAVVPGIDNWGHVGGLFAGMVLGGLIRPPQPDLLARPAEEAPSQPVVIIPILIVALAMAATIDNYSKSRVVTGLLQEGNRLRDKNQPDRAVERFQEAARRAPRDARPHEELGLLYLQQRRADDAVREFEAAIHLGSDSPRAQIGLALAYESKGDPGRAQPLQNALAKVAETAEGQTVIAEVYYQIRLYPQAILHYQEALRRNPKLAEAHNNLAWLYATSQDPRYRNPRGALEHATLAVELTDWKEPGFIDTLAEAFYVNNSFDEAVRAQSKALKLDPDNRELLEHMEKYRKAASGSSYTRALSPEHGRLAACVT
jgi:membrane associated rhomboid family serine protease/tetratricopeptide (TPR) repeat protein